ncbi:hypothetical protein [Archaeoglobus sulfaticallidus]|uniref:hypothetical protein n=1 Tax=Archaeoglobus sulfaticallidus TaxID=1316941 RepID=UPI00064FADAF|nr:hypothetical protein [Archaeoglobus sulfaticallidus]
MDSDTNFKLDKEFLKYLAVHSSPFTSAIALAILDEMTGGKVTEFKKQLENAPSSWVQVPQGAKKKGRC